MVPSLNILLAEDEKSVAFSIVFALQPEGYKVQVVADGREALSSIRVEPDTFDLLITDHSMPGMDGVELVQQLRQESFRGKIIVLSAHLSRENRAAYEALAVDAMVSKPFDVHQLRATIMQLAKEIQPRPGEILMLASTAYHNMLKIAVEAEEPEKPREETYEGMT